MILSLMSIVIRKSGRLKTGAALEDAFLSTEATAAGVEVAIPAMADNTPVISGLGRDSWVPIEGAHFEGHRLVSRFGNTATNRSVYYIPIANVRSKLNHGFIERGLAEARVRAVDAMKARVSAVRSKLWEQTK